MKNLIIAFLFLALAVMPLSAMPNHPSKSEQGKAAHRIEFEVPEDQIGNDQVYLIPEGRGACSSSAIGPHALLTAEHCDLGEEYLTVDNEVGQRKILGRIKDGEDHMIFLVDGSKFKNTMAADYDPDTYVLPTVGEKVFLFGDGAAIWPPQYRTGYYMGSTQVDDSTGADASTDTTLLLLDLNIIPGDSGSAIYGSDGKLVSLVTYGVGGKFCGSYKMAFTWGQIVQAESF